MANLTTKVQRALARTDLRQERQAGTVGIRERAPKALESYPDLARLTRDAKVNALTHLPDLLASAENQLLAHGFHVYRASDAADARNYVLSHIPEPSLVIKSKSNMAKEIHLPEALEQAGHQVVETDLGDHINQLLERRSGHVLMPALGVDIPTIQKVFRERYHEPDLGSTPPELVRAARRHLRPILESSTVSISGANAVTATGEVVLMENEGNIRAVTSLSRRHFVIAGVHKVVANLEDGLNVVQAASLFGVGQDLGNYCTVLAGPGRDMGPEVHVVLIDDGRLSAIEREPEPFYCINCGSCLNVCPIFAQLGEAYGGERLGGIGIMQTFLLNGAGQATEDGLDLCLGCRRCVPACPVQIETPAITNRMKAVRTQTSNSPTRKRFLALVLSERDLRFSRRLFMAAAALGISRRWHRRAHKAQDFIPVPDSARPMPAGSTYRGAEPVRGSVWLFPGCVMNAWYARVHRDTIRVLTQNGYAVHIPEEQACCGALHEHAGEPQVVPNLMSRNNRAFPGNDPIILNSAGCGAFLKQHPGPLSPRIRDLSEFLAEVGMRRPPHPGGKTIVYHNPCHLAYAQGIFDAPAKLLMEAGYRVASSMEREACCGSAGTYNLEFPELAWRLAREKAEDLTQSAPDVVVTANPGCLMQIRAGVDAIGERVPVEHLASMLAACYEGDGR